MFHERKSSAQPFNVFSCMTGRELDQNLLSNPTHMREMTMDDAQIRSSSKGLTELLVKEKKSSVDRERSESEKRSKLTTYNKKKNKSPRKNQKSPLTKMHANSKNIGNLSNYQHNLIE